LAGNVTDAGGGTITERGYVISDSDTTPDRNEERTITDGTGTGAFSETIGSLTPATEYYWRPYAVNGAGVAYGAVDIFSTLSTTPLVTSGSASSIAATSVTCSGDVTSDGGATVTTRGICYDTSATPTTADSIVASGTGTGAFSSNLTGLTAGETYYWRAYATNANGTVYGTEYSFTTKTIITNWSQSFTTISAGTLTKISLYLKETFAGSSTATVKLYDDDSDEPDALLATATKTVSGTSYDWYDFVFSEAVASGTKHHIVLDTPYVVGTRYQYWGANSAGTYGVLQYSVDSGANWTTQSDTAAFKVYIQPSLTVNYDASIDYKKRYL
jgi:hypothetical protein